MPHLPNKGIFGCKMKKFVCLSWLFFVSSLVNISYTVEWFGMLESMETIFLTCCIFCLELELHFLKPTMASYDKLIVEDLVFLGVSHTAFLWILKKYAL